MLFHWKKNLKITNYSSNELFIKPLYEKNIDYIAIAIAA